MHRLNAIAPGTIGDKAHIATLLTQIGLEYILMVDAIQNDQDPVNPTTLGNRLANAEQTVRGKDSPTPPQREPGPLIKTVESTPENPPTARSEAICPRSVERNTLNCVQVTKQTPEVRTHEWRRLRLFPFPKQRNRQSQVAAYCSGEETRLRRFQVLKMGNRPAPRLLTTNSTIKKYK